MVAEGQGVLFHCGDNEDEQAILDIGERTVDLIVAEGQKVLISHCSGLEWGVGQIVNELVAFGKTRGIGLEKKAHALLRSYAQGDPLPIVHGLESREIASEIARSIRKAGRTLQNFIRQHLASDGESVAASYARVYIGGGGAYYFEEIIRECIDPHKVKVVKNPEIANALGYADIAASLHRKKATIWEETVYVA